MEFMCLRPTFVFLKGTAEVDRIRGANKAYVLPLASVPRGAHSVWETAGSRPLSASTHPARPLLPPSKERVTLSAARQHRLPPNCLESAGSANSTRRQRSLSVSSVPTLSFGCSARYRISLARVLILWIIVLCHSARASAVHEAAA